MVGIIAQTDENINICHRNVVFSAKETPHKRGLCGDELEEALHHESGAMLGSMRRLKLNHSTYQHMFHIVWGTRYRRKFLKEYVKPEFMKVLTLIEKRYPTIHVEVMNINNDHVHLQTEIPPNISVAVVVRRMKWLLSLRLKKRFKFIREMYLDGNIWSVGYFSSTIGLNEKTVKDYIIKQGEEDLPKQVDWSSRGKQTRKPRTMRSD